MIVLILQTVDESDAEAGNNIQPEKSRDVRDDRNVEVLGFEAIVALASYEEDDQFDRDRREEEPHRPDQMLVDKSNDTFKVLHGSSTSLQFFLLKIEERSTVLFILSMIQKSGNSTLYGVNCLPSLL